MCFELVELYLENSLSLLKARHCNHQINAQNQLGSCWVLHHSCKEMYSHPQEYLHVILICMSVYLYIHVCALRRPDGRGHNERALLLPRVYLETVTLMQCNDYFYFRYFGSLFPLSGMAPHWPTDYLCGCCHTWLLQLSLHYYTLITFPFITTPSLLSQ